MRPEIREHKVKDHFGHNSIYLAGNNGIQVRAEVISAMCDALDYKNIADLACGNGLISIPLLHNEGCRLTLLDNSSTMIEAARNNIPPEIQHRVSLIEAALDESGLTESGFDLVLCLGLLAHLRDPMKQLNQKVLPLVSKGGHLIIQNTDSRHPYTWLSHHLASAVRSLLGREPYAMNRISHRCLLRELEAAGFRQSGRFRYIVSFPLLGRLMGSGGRLQIIRSLFGNYGAPRLQWLGNDSIFLLTKES
jgi:ubiquinone/menaquinone biosynthesis C-methylase UbiE